MSEPTPKLRVAIELLDRALRMYYEGDSYFAALHLAGAADEILGVYVERKGDDSSFNSLQAGAVKISQILDPGAESKPKDIKSLMNYARNRTKHIDKAGDDDVHFDPKTEAFDTLSRAVSNYYMLMRYFNLQETEHVRRFNSERRT
jgi:hypothetical protein